MNNYLHINTMINYMNQDHFSSLAILNIDKNALNNVKSNDVLKIYSKENRRPEL